MVGGEREEIRQTQQSYAGIAAAYAAARGSREGIRGQLEQFVGLVRPRGRVLDIGCGPGFDTALLAESGLQPVGLDFSLEMMVAGRAQHRQRLPFVCADMRRLPFARRFDGFWACASLLHLPRMEMVPVLRGMHRLARSGAILYLSMKQGEGEEWQAESYGYPSPRFFSYWQPEQLDEALRAGGWELVGGWAERSPHAVWLVRFAHSQNTGE